MHRLLRSFFCSIETNHKEPALVFSSHGALTGLSRGCVAVLGSPLMRGQLDGAVLEANEVVSFA
jgi:hypothetical protein